MSGSSLRVFIRVSSLSVNCNIMETVCGPLDRISARLQFITPRGCVALLLFDRAGRRSVLVFVSQVQNRTGEIRAGLFEVLQ